VSCAKTAEPTEMRFGLRALMVPRNHVLDEITMGWGNFEGGGEGLPIVAYTHAVP